MHVYLEDLTCRSISLHKGHWGTYSASSQPEIELLQFASGRFSPVCHQTSPKNRPQLTWRYIKPHAAVCFLKHGLTQMETRSMQQDFSPSFSRIPGPILSLGYCRCGVLNVLPMSRFSRFPPEKNMLVDGSAMLNCPLVWLSVIDNWLVSHPGCFPTSSPAFLGQPPDPPPPCPG